MADGISDNGSIAAASRDAGGNNTLAGFKWQADVMTDLGLYTGHTALRPWGVNSQGKVVGRATNGPGRSNDGVLHDGSGWQLAGWAGGTRGNAFGINESNQVVGNMRLPTNDFSRALIRTPGGGTIELPTLFPDDPGTSTPADTVPEKEQTPTITNARANIKTTPCFLQPRSRRRRCLKVDRSRATHGAEGERGQ